MNRNKKTLAVIAAALLAVSPVAASAISAPAAQTTVKAATQLSSDQLMAQYYNDAENNYGDASDFALVKLTKANPYLTVYDGETVRDASKRRITDVTSNLGHVSKMSNENGFLIYKTFDDGRPDFSQRVRYTDKLHAGQSYVADIAFIVNNVKENNAYCINQYNINEDLDGAWLYDSGEVSLLVPVNVEPASAKPVVKKPARKSSTKRAYVKVRKNRRVRTYTSRGKFSRHYVYGHHTYKVTSKKHIKGHGNCWKLSGKNQYVPAKYVRVR